MYSYRRDRIEMKLFKNKKALSPVVAAIILIAVTVAVSIAVAAWMGALTFTFMKTEELKVTGMTFNGTSGAADNTITVSLKNSGTSKVSLAQVKINDVTKSTTETLPLDINAGATGSVTVTTAAWASGSKYKVTLISASGTPIGAYEATA